MTNTVTNRIVIDEFQRLGDEFRVFGKDIRRIMDFSGQNFNETDSTFRGGLQCTDQQREGLDKEFGVFRSGLDLLVGDEDLLNGGDLIKGQGIAGPISIECEGVKRRVWFSVLGHHPENDTSCGEEIIK
ncbi:hypothetical protein WICPIJ_000416 [Wickerhamomyces pijperi]|uniref:Uncharacterized protein n=1 Tax=Wickerhamomyces pijperi TaxID=599730 RepID=A0A9P8TRV7_WICPI|nr:hypothetical protein WICPIJ_000416 [Wickerhamomyces pijperi]